MNILYIFSKPGTDFSREDVGEYSCKVIRTSPTIAEVGSDTIRADLLFFPPASDPQCFNSGDPITIMEGSTLDLNCSSELGNPSVEIGWTRAGHPYSNGAAQEIIGNRIYSSITVTVTMENEGNLFLCEIEGVVDPYKRNCHAGPLRVIPNPDNNGISRPPVNPNNLLTTPNLPDSPHYPSTKSVANTCKDLCHATESVPKPWIISTIITGVVAILLLLIIIIVSAKYTGYVSSARSTTSIYQRSPDDIYTELQYRKGDLMYVPADKAKAMLEQARTEQDTFDTNSPYGES